MASVNKTILVGNLGRDPEVTYMPNGNACCNISVATTETWKDKNTGEKKEATEWHRCVIFGKLGEIAGQYLKKGSQVFLEGRLQTRKWQDKEGVERYSTEHIINEMKMLGGPAQGNSDGGNRGSSGQQYGGQQSRPAQQSQQGQKKASFDDIDDDIPF